MSGGFNSPQGHTTKKPSTGKTKDEELVSGSITIPEVAHDTEEDEYVVCSLLCPSFFRLSISGPGMKNLTMGLCDNSLRSTSTLSLPRSNP